MGVVWLREVFVDNLPPGETPGTKKKINIVRIIAITGIVMILGISIAMGTIAKSPSTLDASIQWDGDQFRITNNNDFQWDEINLALNSDYKLKVGILMGHSELVVPYNEFVKDDGTKFDVTTMSPSGFYIFAQVANNQTGSWFYKFP
jgi:hypothetical protein